MGRTQRKRKKRSRDNIVEHRESINLQKWMKQKTHLQIYWFQGIGRGIRSKKKIRSGDILISVPIRLLITPNVSSEALNLVDPDALPAQVALSIFLMYERHLSEGSMYKHYINLLPTSYSTLFFCSPAEIELLPHFMKIEILQKKRLVKEQYKKILKLYCSKPCLHCGINFNDIFQFQYFTWAWFTVNTRSVYYKDEVQESMALAPFLDMFNHSFNAKVDLSIDQKRGLYILKSLNEYKKNEQVFIKYGSHSNLTLLSEYGFILDNNPNDFIEFSFNEVVICFKKFKPQNGELDRKKYKFIKQNNLNKNLTKSKGELSWNCNALLYVLITKDENLSLIQMKCYSNKFDDEEWSQINELIKLLISTKKEEFFNDLKRMESISEVSHSFSLAKNLLRIYIGLLE